MTTETHLAPWEVTVPQGAEWRPEKSNWCLLQARSGDAYWLAGGEARPLEVGELLIISPWTAGQLRASQLTALKLNCCFWRPGLLSGVLSLVETDYFNSEAIRAASRPIILSAQSVESDQFAQICRQANSDLPMIVRARLIQLIGGVFAGEIAKHIGQGARVGPASERFQQLVGELAANEIVALSPQELARRCGCSARHFSRMFHEHFGVSLREKQTEIRLGKATALLSNGSGKIIDVALDSGYRHLGLFNRLFKKHLGATPSQWRQRNLEAPRAKRFRGVRRVLGIAGILWCGLQAALAADAPGANNPTAQAPANSGAPVKGTNAVQGFKVTAYKVEGNTVLSPAIIEKTLAPYTGDNVTFDTIRKGLGDLQMAYRDRGFVTCKLGLPQQRLTNGIVRVEVTEGRLSDIAVFQNRFFSSNNVMRALPGLRTNILLNSLVFEQELDRANVNLDRQVYPEIGSGPDPGTTSLKLKVVDRLPLHAHLEFDNQTTPGTPDTRVDFSTQYNNLWQLNHQLGIQYSFSPANQKEATQYIDYPFDSPRVSSYSAFYRMPLPWASGESEPLAARLTSQSFGYDEISRKFRAPALLGDPELIAYASRGVSDTGNNLVSETLTPPVIAPSGSLQVRDGIYNETVTYNEDLGFRWNQPLKSFWDIASSVSAGVDYKAFRQFIIDTRVDQATVYVPVVGTNGPPFTAFPSPPNVSMRQDPGSGSVNYLPFAVNWEGAKRDKWGVTSLSVNQSFNFQALSASSSTRFAKIAQTSTEHASGTYYILNPGLTREQTIYQDWAVTLKANGQWGSESLIGNEQFAMGGLAGPRGYRDGEQYGDAGWRISLEPHTPLFHVAMINSTIPWRMRFSIFTDYGQRYDYTTKFTEPDGAPIPIPERVGQLNLWGAGFGFSGTIGKNFDYRFATAFPLLGTPLSPAGNPRIYFALAAQF